MPRLVDTLNEQGIGTARYLPRVFELFADRASEVDWRAEIADACGALELLRAQPWVDPEELYLFGLSLGGLVAPQAARRVGGVAGIASFGSTARSWTAYSADNFEIQLRFMGYSSSKIRAWSKLEKRWGELLHETELDGAQILDRAPELKRLGVTDLGRHERSVAFWRQVAKFAPAAAYQGLSCRILALRGSADCCCHESDQESIAIAAEAAGLEFERIVLNGIDHGFRESAGPSESLRGEVSAEPHPEPIGRALARWIKRESQPVR